MNYEPLIESNLQAVKWKEWNISYQKEAYVDMDKIVFALNIHIY